jgi:hypothetical protein
MQAQEQESVTAFPSLKPDPTSEPEGLSKLGGKISLEIVIAENDLRARQFACHLSLANHTVDPINLLAINYRLGTGVHMEKTENTSLLDLKQEYDQLRNDIRYIFRVMYISRSERFRIEVTKNYLETLRKMFEIKTIGMLYWYTATGKFKKFADQMNLELRRMDFPVTSSESARLILPKLADAGPDAVTITELATAKIDRMHAIEQVDPNFLKPEYVTQIMPGENFEQVFIFKAQRKLSSIASYTAAFDVKLSVDAPGSARPIERILSRSASFNVTPSPITLSIFAVIFSILGTLLNNVGLQSISKRDLLDTLTAGDFLQRLFVAAVLAIVLYNSFEMTEFKDKIRSISWRSAMFIGLLCGLLSDRMLKAITSFVG